MSSRSSASVCFVSSFPAFFLSCLSNTFSIVFTISAFDNMPSLSVSHMAMKSANLRSSFSAAAWAAGIAARETASAAAASIFGLNRMEAPGSATAATPHELLQESFRLLLVELAHLLRVVLVEHLLDHLHHLGLRDHAVLVRVAHRHERVGIQRI